MFCIFDFLFCLIVSAAEDVVRGHLKAQIERFDRLGCYHTLRRVLPVEIFKFLNFREPRPPKRPNQTWGVGNIRVSRPTFCPTVPKVPTPSSTVPVGATEDEKKLLEGYQALLEQQRQEEKEARRRQFEISTTLEDLKKSK